MPGQFVGVRIVDVQGVCGRLRARGRSCLRQTELFALLVLSMCRVCADTCTLWAVVAASTAYTSFFFFTVQGAEVLGSVFYCSLAFLVLHIHAHNVGDGRCTITLHFLLHAVYDVALSGRERFRSIDIQVDSSLARRQSLFRSIVVPCEIKSSGHSG